MLKFLPAMLLIVTLATLGASESPWKAYFDGQLVDAQGKEVSLDQLKNKMVGIYFSAHWCGPCRAFTPELVKFRNKNKAFFEVVFVSSDRSEEEKKKYMTEAKMSWPSLPLNGAASKKLDEKFKVTGLPTLLVLSRSGKLITKTGREEIMKDPNVAMKWAAKDKAMGR